ncbi:MAG: hypothetical protein GVY27_11175, partial [Deinococcus-Thermus bacterium]|nr:hypothetical protein [Deinococcota bacterium]
EPEPEPEPDPEPEPEPDPTEAAILSDLARLVNEARSEGRTCGSYGYFESAPPLTIDSTLMDVAEAHSVDQAEMGTMSHTGSDGSDLRDRVDRVGYAWMALGENVAWNQRTAEWVMDAWLGSAGHCRNIMNPMFEELGLGLEDWYWTQVFATPR